MHGKKISSLDFTPENQVRKILNDFNPAILEDNRHIVIQDLINHSFHENSNRVALQHDDIAISYKELNSRINRLAHYIKNLIEEGDIGSIVNTPIAVHIDEGVDRVVAMLAVLKSGGCYLPITPSLPPERVKYILNDSCAPLMLSSDLLIPGIKRIEGTSLKHVLDVRKISLENSYLNSDPEVSAKPEDICYIVYTSGTTGNPKGVLVENNGLVDRHFAWKRIYGSSYKSRMLQLADYGFDVGVAETIKSVCSGGTLVFTPSDIKSSGERLVSFIEQNRIEVADFTPNVLNNITGYLKSAAKKLSCMKTIVVGSDAWSIGDHQRALNYLGKNTRLLNMYGLTECTVDSTYYEQVSEKDRTLGMSVIGKPLQNCQVYILDEFKKLCPVGSVGEIYIGGSGVANGYLTYLKLSDEKFVDNPFLPQQCNYTKMYRTGDIGRWLGNGDIELLGRMDSQVKVNGYRIELAEIEQAIQELDDIEQAVVTVVDRDKRKHLCAYVIESNDDTDTVSDQKFEEKTYERLLTRLPQYMLPSAIKRLDELPVTRNGKIDRKSLPAVELTVKQADYVSPVNDEQKVLVELWQRVLGVDKVGINDNFFLIGGDSIKTLNIVALAHEAGVDLMPRHIFEFQTINNISNELNRKTKEDVRTLSFGAHKISSNQHLILREFQAYEDSIIGSREPLDGLIKRQFFQVSYDITGLDSEQISSVIYKLINRHNALRIVFRTINGEWQAEYESVDSVCGMSIVESHGCATDASNSVDISKPALADIEKNLASGVVSPLVVCVQAQQCNTSSTLKVYLNKLIVDRESVSLLLDDLEKLVSGEQQNREVKNHYSLQTYQEWALERASSIESVHERSNADDFKTPEKWGSLSFLESASKRILKKVLSKKTENQEVVAVSPEETAILLGRCNSAFGTNTDDILISVLMSAIRNWKGVTINDVLFRRSDRLDLALQKHGNTVGNFDRIFRLPLSCSATSENENYGSLLTRVKDVLNSVYGAPQLHDVDAGISPADTLFVSGIEHSDSLDKVSLHGPSYIFEIISLIENDRLCIYISSKNESVSSSVFNSFVKHFREKLKDISEYCESKSSPYYVRNLPDTVMRSVLEESTWEFYKPFAKFNENSNSSTLFCISPSGASIESYFRLGKLLSKEQEIVLLENIELHLNKEFSLPSLATYYASLIEKISDGKEIYLFGGSKGALLAHEVANLLSRIGVPIKSLFLVDPIGYTLSENDIQSIEQDPRFVRMSSKEQLDFNSFFHQFCASAEFNRYLGPGLVFQTYGITNNKSDWSIVENIAFDHFEFFTKQQNEPDISYGLEEYFPACKGIKLKGNHADFLSKDNIETISTAMNTVFSNN